VQLFATVRLNFIYKINFFAFLATCHFSFSLLCYIVLGGFMLWKWLIKMVTMMMSCYYYWHFYFHYFQYIDKLMRRYFQPVSSPRSMGLTGVCMRIVRLGRRNCETFSF